MMKTTKIFGLAAVLLSLASAPSANAGPCPGATSLTKLVGSAEFVKAGPFDAKTVTKATATKSAFGLTVFLSNQEIDTKAAAANLTVSPVKEKGKVALAITFMNASKTLAAGDYEVRANVFDPMNVRADLAYGQGADGLMYGLTQQAGKGSIIELNDSQVCGTFAINGSNGSVAGSFVATIVK